MTATDELRKMLDEAEEYYKTSGNKTWWGRPIDMQTGKPINVFHYQAQPMGEDRLFVELQLATPAQAIAATLGAGTCHDVAGMDDVFECSACGGRYQAWAIKRWARYCPDCGRRIEVEE